jgi:hypothetical protein
MRRGKRGNATRRGGFSRLFGASIPAPLLKEGFGKPGTLTAPVGIYNDDGAGVVTGGDHTGSGPSNVVIYCVYSVR